MKGVEVLKKMKEDVKFGFQKVEWDKRWWGCKKDEWKSEVWVLEVEQDEKWSFTKKGKTMWSLGFNKCKQDDKLGFTKSKQDKKKFGFQKKLNKTKGVVEIMCKTKVVTSSSNATMQQPKYQVEFLQDHNV